MGGLKFVIAVTVVISQIASLCYAMHSFPAVSMPATCANKTFCFDKDASYPGKLIDNLLIGTQGIFEDVNGILGHRFGSEIPPNECVPITRVAPIYEIVDEAGNNRYVVQSEKKFMQIIRTEECADPGPITRKTRNLSAELAIMYKLACKEKTLDYKFVVLSLDGTKMEAVRVQGGVPVCCSCVREEN